MKDLSIERGASRNFLILVHQILALNPKTLNSWQRVGELNLKDLQILVAIQ